MMPEFGDVVKVVTKDEAIEGILMPRPEIFGKGYTVIKLSNGYNIGIEDSKIEKIELVSKYKKKHLNKEKGLPHNNSLPTVSILSFGGTISSKVDYKTGGTYAVYTAEDFVEMMPELANIANLRAEKVIGIMSEDMNPEIWSVMAKRIAKELNDETVSGVVVTQGTDTLHFSAAAMSFFLKGINKPVVVTGAQRSIDRGSSDAHSNLLCSVIAASKFDGAVVATCLHENSSDGTCILIRGTKVRKMHTSRRDAFRPINEKPLARIFEDGKIEILNSNYEKRNSNKVHVDDKFESKTALVYAYPGMDPDIFDFYIGKKYKGIVIAGTGLGNLAGFGEETPSFSLSKKIKELRENNIAIVITSQTIYGRVHPYVYSNLRKLSIGLNCIFAEDMHPETAYVKLGWVLGHAHDIEKVKEMMLANYAHEINDRHDEDSFLW